MGITVNKSFSTLAQYQGKSNVLFEWHGSDNLTNNNVGCGMMISVTKDDSTQAKYMLQFWSNTQYSLADRRWLISKFVKIAGINTITIHARICSVSASATYNAQCHVYIGGSGGLTNYVEKNGTAIDWATPATIDVSSLVNGTVYDIDVFPKILNYLNAGTIASLYDVVLIGS
jgi:hypothetical protein